MADSILNTGLSDKNPYANLFWDMMESAASEGASDVHVQPDRTGVHIRFRIHGELVAWKWISEPHKPPFLQEAKRLSHCQLGVSGRPQDARFSLSNQSIDVRVNLVPTLYGEKLVLRLLDQRRSFALEKFRIGDAATEAIRRALSLGTGVCLITGPTGSGKTTLLYSALNALDRERLNIVTIEDPVEYSMPGISQIQVGAKLSFADALRAILRQDPDVILVGEVRDRETAELCFQAAATGHLVLSTLHANSAREVQGRIHALGVREDLIRSCLRFSSAQRLLPELCPACAEPLVDGAIGEAAADRNGFKRRLASGCSKCRQGLIGVIPAFEYAEWSDGEEAPPRLSAPLKEAALELARLGKVDAYDAMAV